MKIRRSFYENDRKESKENSTVIDVLFTCHYKYIIDGLTYSQYAKKVHSVIIHFAHISDGSHVFQFFVDDYIWKKESEKRGAYHNSKKCDDLGHYPYFARKSFNMEYA